MKITLSEPQIQVILAALEAFQRFRINQPKTALEQIFPKQYHDLDWDKMEELCRPIQQAFFPDYPPNGGPGICNSSIGKEPQIAYEIQKQIEQYLALKKNGGYFGSGREFDGADLNPSGEPPPKIEGLEEMKYKDFLVPEECQDTIRHLIENKSYPKLWQIINDALPDLPRGDKMEVINKFMDDNGDFRLFHVRVYKPRKKIDGSEF
jgi:hypothetical protein